MSEPWLFQSDLNLATNLLNTHYKIFLNSDDLFDPNLPLIQSRPQGGTLTMWKSELDPFITVLPPQTSRISTIIFDPPDIQTTVHINIYLPTAGRESDFIETLATLQATIDEVYDQYPAALIYVKGDANASISPRIHNKRDHVFKSFCEDNCFLPLDLNNHKTYHHFTGDGISDSSIDVALSSSLSADGTPSPFSKILLQILCCKEYLETSNSHHDAILTLIPLSFNESNHESSATVVPTVENKRHRVVWSDENIESYCNLIHPVLADLQNTWLEPGSPSSISVLLQQTNTVLNAAAKATQQVIPLNSKPKPKKTPIPPELTQASKNHRVSHKNLLNILSNHSASISESNSAKSEFSRTRALLQTAKRLNDNNMETDATDKLHSILSSNPSSLYRAIKSNKRDCISINKLNVGNDVFLGDDIGKGFYKSISALKTRSDDILDCPTFKSFLTDHKHIMEICMEGLRIPPLNFSQAHKLLKSIKPSVTDIFSISALHYLNGGDPAVTHFQLLLNAVIGDVENYALSEINTVHAIIPHKGHGKDKHSNRSYRTISTCPFIAKCADKYVGSLE